MEKLIETSMNPVFSRPTLNEATGEKGGEWSVPVWNLDERNLNGRTYTTALAERLVQESKKTLCNDGHDECGHEYGNAQAFAYAPYIDGNQLWVKFRFVDPSYESRIVFCLENGISVGVSSVGMGTTDDKGIVDADTYELVRWFDFVNHPANETFVQKEDIGKPSEPSPEVQDSSTEERDANIRRLLRIHFSNQE